MLLPHVFPLPHANPENVSPKFVVPTRVEMRQEEHENKGTDAPVIPVFLDEFWGSKYSHDGGKRQWNRSRVS